MRGFTDEILVIMPQGANSHGQLGLGYESEQCTSPHRLETIPFEPQKVREIAGGGAHVLVLDSERRLFACGWNHRGQLGVNSTEDLQTFVEIPAVSDKEVVELACGWDTSAAIDSSGRLFVWGSNAFGQLGLCPSTVPFATLPTELHLPDDRKASRISFGLRFLCILCTDSTIWFVGRIKFRNRCAVTTDKGAEFLRLLYDQSFGAKHISCGANHVAIANETSVIGFGCNKFGQTEEVHLESEIVCLRSGWTHSAALTDDGRVFLYGRNTYGQLGHGDALQTKLVQLNCDEVVEELHLGSEHGLIRTGSGKLMTWGWNEHGNCGNGSEQNVCVYLHLILSNRFMTSTSNFSEFVRRRLAPTTVRLPGKSHSCGTGAGFCYAVVGENASHRLV